LDGAVGTVLFDTADTGVCGTGLLEEAAAEAAAEEDEEEEEEEDEEAGAVVVVFLACRAFSSSIDTRKT
jgi:hypothetical protein